MYQFSRETTNKVADFIAHQKSLNVPKSLINMRAENYRRTLELNPDNNKRRRIPGVRKFKSDELGFPMHAKVPAKAAARLERRMLAFNSMSAIQQASHTRPGSYKK